MSCWPRPSGLAAGASLLCRQDNGSKHTNQLSALLNLRPKFHLGHRPRLHQKIKPIQAFARFLLSDTELMDEIGAAFSGLRLFDVCADGASGTEVLLTEDPTSAIPSFLQIPIQVDC